MNEQNQISATALNVFEPNTKIEQIIDLFVEMCFEDIYNVKRVSQFKLLGIQLGFSTNDVEKVIEMGKEEYNTLMDEISKTFLTNDLN